MASVLVLSGPNIGRLGTRQPEVYGHTTHDDLAVMCQDLGKQLGLDVEVRQSDSEAELIGWLHEAADRGANVVLNAGAFTHYSYAVRDACSIVAETGVTLVEVHISNPAAREEFRHVSVISAVVTGSISGFGVESYLLGLRAIAARRQSA